MTHSLTVQQSDLLIKLLNLLTTIVTDIISNDDNLCSVSCESHV